MWSNAQNILAIIHVVQFFAPCHLAVNQYGHIFIYWIKRFGLLSYYYSQANKFHDPPTFSKYVL